MPSVKRESSVSSEKMSRRVDISRIVNAVTGRRIWEETCQKELLIRSPNTKGVLLLVGWLVVDVDVDVVVVVE